MLLALGRNPTLVRHPDSRETCHSAGTEIPIEWRSCLGVPQANGQIYWVTVMPPAEVPA